MGSLGGRLFLLRYLFKIKIKILFKLKFYLVVSGVLMRLFGLVFEVMLGGG